MTLNSDLTMPQEPKQSETPLRKKRQTIERHYSINVHYSRQDECFIARSPSWPYIAADGETEVEAVRSMADALAGAMEVSRKRKKRMPDDDPLLAALRRLRPIINLNQVARMSGVSRNTLNSKIKRGTGFTESESNRLRESFESLGIPIEA